MSRMKIFMCSIIVALMVALAPQLSLFAAEYTDITKYLVKWNIDSVYSQDESITADIVVTGPDIDKIYVHAFNLDNTSDCFVLVNEQFSNPVNYVNLELYDTPKRCAELTPGANYVIKVHVRRAGDIHGGTAVSYFSIGYLGQDNVLSGGYDDVLYGGYSYISESDLDYSGDRIPTICDDLRETSGISDVYDTVNAGLEFPNTTNTTIENVFDSNFNLGLDSCIDSFQNSSFEYSEELSGEEEIGSESYLTNDEHYDALSNTSNVYEQNRNSFENESSTYPEYEYGNGYRDNIDYNYYDNAPVISYFDNEVNPTFAETANDIKITAELPRKVTALANGVFYMNGYIYSDVVIESVRLWIPGTEVDAYVDNDSDFFDLSDFEELSIKNIKSGEHEIKIQINTEYSSEILSTKLMVYSPKIKASAKRISTKTKPTATIKVTGVPKEYTVKYVSMSKKYISVSSKGKVTAKKKGSGKVAIQFLDSDGEIVRESFVKFKVTR